MKHSSITSKIKSISSWFLLSLIVLLPTLVIPLTNNLINQTKLFIIIWGALTTFLLFIIRSFKNNSWQLIISPNTLLLTLFGLSTLGSAFLTQSYPVENLLGFGSAYLGFVIIAIFAPSLIKKNKADTALGAITLAACIVSISSLLQLVGFGPSKLISLIAGIDLPHNLIFNIAGSSLIAAQLIVLALVGQIVRLVQKKTLSTFNIISIPLLVFGLGLHVWSLLPGQTSALGLTPLSASWLVALDSLRVPKTALIGQGPEGYLETFARYRPSWLNGQDNWQTLFKSASSYPLSILVQLGFLGLTAWLILAVRFILESMKNSRLRNSPLTWIIGLSFILQLIFPPSFTIIGIQGLLLAFWATQFKDEFYTLNLKPLSVSSVEGGQLDHASKEQESNNADNIFSITTNALLLIGLGVLFFLSGKAYASFFHIHQASKAMLNEDGIGVYEHQRTAVRLNPYLDSNRREYAITNLQIATALSNKTDATQQETQQVTQLVQQAVREARAATTIDPADYRNWLILANVYGELIGSVEEADQWAVNAYVSAIENNPSDPILRIDLGNLLLGQEQIRQAANVYNQAVNLKPNLPSAYYHLGRAQQMGKDLEGAKRSWTQALTLLEQRSKDYADLEQGIKQLEDEIKAASAAAEKATPTQQPELDAPTPLSQEIPSVTDQNLEIADEKTISQPSNEPLELSAEDEELINEGGAKAGAEETKAN